MPISVAPLPRVMGDACLLRQVYVNLIGNAIKFSQEVAVPRIEVGALEQHGVVAYFVRDNGIGFDADQAARLFEPFQPDTMACASRAMVSG